MRLSMIATALIFGGLAISSAEAMPISAIETVKATSVVKVDYPCGRGWHMTPRGSCRPNGWRPPPREYGYGYGWGHRPPPPRGWHGGDRRYGGGWGGDRWHDRPRDW